MENTLENFIENIFLFVLNEKVNQKGLLVKKHTENLSKHGEFSFPNTVKSWHEYIPPNLVSEQANTTLLQYIGKDIFDLIEQSKVWNLQVKTAKENKGRIHMFIERPRCINIGLAEALRNIAYITQAMNESTSKVIIDQQCVETDSLTYLRMKHVSRAIKNLCSITGSIRDDTEIMVTSKSSSINHERVVLCGTVLNAKTGAKETSISANDYIRMRQDEMTLIAQHKHGVRASTESYWKEFIENLGESAVIFELLQTKPSSAVKVNFDCSSAGSSKGAAFILYNCARLETIIKSYVLDGKYPPLPDLGDTDLTLLTGEDEWCLIFNYVMSLPTLLRTSVEVGENTCDFRPHHICNFLSSLVLVFSRYYRKSRILMMPRIHLLPVIYARIHMLRILNDTLKTCLKIINIKSFLQM